MRNDFSTFDIMKALSLKRDKLRSWMRDGFIKPKYPAEGQGTKAVFTRWDVYGVALFKDLIDHGYKRKAVSKYIYNFIRIEESLGPKVKKHEEVEYILFRHEVISGEVQVSSTVISKQRGGNLVLDLDDWDHLHLVNFKKLKKNIDSALLEL